MTCTAPSTSRVVVHTTRPDVAGTLQPLITNRLIIRTLHVSESDLSALWSIRSQPEAMTSSGSGLPDANLDETNDKLRRLQPPYHDSHVYFGIFLRNMDGTEGEIIGDGGVHRFQVTETGWPEFGYKLKKAFWNKRYTTEFAAAFMEFWWRIPRKPVSIQVHHSTTAVQATTQVPEQLCAWTKAGNDVSEKVLRRLGFEPIKGMGDDHRHYWRLSKDLYELATRQVGNQSSRTMKASQ
ncbi:acetyltransferase domain-containing protein [Xylariomycetidae sp. FL0641]|nr:acetyltransferase domain-containing protein [Xylariomycetidae sp. FL0641]